MPSRLWVSRGLTELARRPSGLADDMLAEAGREAYAR